MKPTATVCTLTLLLAAPLAPRCAAAAIPQQGRDRVAQLSAECEKAKYASCNSLGLMYEEGNGAAKDAKRAEELYRRACDRGSFTACSNLGAMYGSGDGIAKDEKVAIKLYQQACDGGEGRGCKNLGVV